jgi:hypothetical protein
MFMRTCDAVNAQYPQSSPPTSRLSGPIKPSSTPQTKQLYIVKMQPLDSSSVAAAGYDASRHQLTLAFRHGGLYRYFGVPRRAYRALLQAESKGQFFTGQIRGHYRFEKVDES